MRVGKKTYVPALKWRQGEYLALEGLNSELKKSICPLLLVPPIEWDFEEKKLKKSTHDHIERFPERLCLKWGLEKTFIHLDNSLYSGKMNDGSHPLKFIFENLVHKKSKAVPAITLEQVQNHLTDIKNLYELDILEICIILKQTDLAKGDVDKSISSLQKELGIDNSQIHLLINLENPESFEPYEGFSKAIAIQCKKLKSLKSYASFSILSTSLKVKEVKKPGGEVRRHEWHLYKHLVIALETIRIPSFGDFTIESPEFIATDMRLLNPGGKIVYCLENTWLIPKGGSFRADTSQMKDHCAFIVNSGFFSGPTFSIGDKRIFETHNGLEGTGNLSVWKKVAVSHHLTLVTKQIASFHGV